VDSDHNLVVITVRIKLKKIIKAEGGHRCGTVKLTDCITAIDYKYDSDRALESQAKHESSVHAKWKTFKQAVLTTATTTLGHTKQIRNRKQWITAEVIDKMTKRRKWKLVNSEEGRTRCRALNNKLRRETDKAKEK